MINFSPLHLKSEMVMNTHARAQFQSMMLSTDVLLCHVGFFNLHRRANASSSTRPATAIATQVNALTNTHRAVPIQTWPQPPAQHPRSGQEVLQAAQRWLQEVNHSRTANPPSYETLFGTLSQHDDSAIRERLGYPPRYCDVISATASPAPVADTKPIQIQYALE